MSCRSVIWARSVTAAVSSAIISEIANNSALASEASLPSRLQDFPFHVGDFVFICYIDDFEMTVKFLGVQAEVAEEINRFRLGKK